MSATVISKSERGGMRLCRLQLANGEKLLIKLILEPRAYLGIWAIGSLNPITVFFDWLLSLRTGRRTAGCVQLWGLGEEYAGDRDSWRAAVRTLFEHEGDDRALLESVVETVFYSSSIDEFRGRLDAAQEWLKARIGLVGRTNRRFSFDLNNPLDVERIDRIRTRFADQVSNDKSPYAKCTFTPASLLPFPKEEIAAGLNTLLEYVRGQRESLLLDEGIRTPEIDGAISDALSFLDNYLDVDESQLPADPKANFMAGDQLRSQLDSR